MMLASGTTAYAKENKEDYRAVFDAQYYYEQNPDLQESIGMNPEALFEHFAVAGAKEGRSGNAEFNLKAYIYNNPDLFLAYKKDYSEYCKHYAAIGKNEGRIALRQEEQGNIIGSWTTYFDETIPRATNVRLAAQRINGKVLQPGEVMSFSNSIMSRTVANGYVSAPLIKGYGIGGGICQVSSTLYYSTLFADLQIDERTNHGYVSDYIPKGMDATVTWEGADFQFTNSTNFPIRIEAWRAEGYVNVQIIGTDERDYYIKMSYKVRETTPFDTIYEEYPPDNPKGYKDGQEIVSPYIGYIVQTYKEKYSKETDELISKDKWTYDVYKKRDQVICKIVTSTPEETT